MRISRNALVAPLAAGVLALGLAACGDDPDETSAEDSPTQSAEPTEPTDDPSDEQSPDVGTSDVVASAIAAIDAAEQDAGGTAFEISEEDGGGWEVDVALGDRYVGVHVDANGQVTGTDDEDDMDDDDRAGLAAAEITLADALTTAEGSAPSGTLDGADLDTEGGDHVWSVSFEDGDVEHEVHVDVVSGDVVHVETDD